MRIFYSLSFLFVVAFQSLFCQVPEPSKTIMVPMRDGTELTLDFYFPDSNPEKLPCVLLRSPAGRKNMFALGYLTLVEHGYVVAIQDTRSAQDLDGKTFPFWYDGWGEEQDGYDTVEWLAASEFCNGDIGTVGISALGITQYMLAPSAPPSLKCQHVGTAASSIFHHALCHGGQIQKEVVEKWLSLYAPDPGVHSYATNQLFYNDFWQHFDATHVAHQVQAPALHFGGWYDIFLKGTIDAFVAFQERGGEGARGKQKLLIGPWTHLWPHDPRFGDFELPQAGVAPPVDLSHLGWLNYHLKGIDNGLSELPAVTYYVMGPFDGTESGGNVWRHADRWPIPHVETPFYLTAEENLVEEPPVSSKSSFPYIYNPLLPVPTVGGRNLFMESGPKDQSAVELREDVLLFTSAPLTEEIEITGKVIAKLFFSSDQEDTDVTVVLTDVYPDGRSVLITEGICRTGIRKHLIENPTSEVEVDLWSTSMVFAKGHRIRVAIASSNYPRYERNLNVGLVGANSGKHAIAHNAIHVGSNHQSRLILPVVRKGNHWLTTN